MRECSLIDVICKNNSKDEEKSQFLNGKRSDNLKYWKHSLFVMFLCSSLLFATCLYVLELY